MSEKIFWADNESPHMRASIKRAQETFKYFWREMAWERRRMIPAFGVSMVKVPFSESDGSSPEQMWVDEIDFDGRYIYGVLANDPNHLTSIRQGDDVRVEIDEISDWLLTENDHVIGGFTVNAIRADMSAADRDEHDAAWGLIFPADPHGPATVPSWFEGDIDAEHPMSLNMAESLNDHLKSTPADVHGTDDHGLTLLHQLALAGSTSGVSVLLQNGAKPEARTKEGYTALDLAKMLDWEPVERLLSADM